MTSIKNLSVKIRVRFMEYLDKKMLRIYVISFVAERLKIIIVKTMSVDKIINIQFTIEK